MLGGWEPREGHQQLLAMRDAAEFPDFYPKMWQELDQAGSAEKIMTTVFTEPVTYRGQILEVEIGMENVKYTLHEGASLTIRHETEEIQLTRENPASVRPISSR